MTTLTADPDLSDEVEDETQAPGEATKLPGPLRAIRRYCVWCVSGQMGEVRECPSVKCALHRFRFGRSEAGVSRLRAIRAKCLDCSGHFQPEVKGCAFEGQCDLWPYRMGRNPSLAGKGGAGNIARLQKCPDLLASVPARRVSEDCGTESTKDTIPANVDEKRGV
jgi:hypothetical protein